MSMKIEQDGKVETFDDVPDFFELYCSASDLLRDVALALEHNPSKRNLELRVKIEKWLADNGGPI